MSFVNLLPMAVSKVVAFEITSGFKLNFNSSSSLASRITMGLFFVGKCITLPFECLLEM